MRKVSCTRMELLAHKLQIELARQGRDLLENKRTALLKELLKVANTVIEHTEALQDEAAQARQALSKAEATAGSEAVRSAALSSRAELNLQISTANVMGVKVPNIEQRRVSRSASDRGYSIVGTSIYIDEAAAGFEAQVEAILRLARSELRLKRLLTEIQTTTRRQNALENLIIPELEAEQSFIQMTLDERERADHFRLKLIKRAMERKRDTSSQ